jgi:endonuclease III
MPVRNVGLHVHRVTNRQGCVATRTPEQMMATLASRLPRTHWIELNPAGIGWEARLHGNARDVFELSVLDTCRRAGVTDHR